LPSKFRLKRLFKGRFVKFVARNFAKIHLEPNHVTLMGPILSIVAVLLFYIGGSIIGSILFGILIFFIMLLDGVDGALARLTDTQSDFGGFFDSLMDRYADIILILGYLIIFDPNLMSDCHFNYFFPLFIWVFFALIGFLMTSYSRSLADKNGVVDTNIGLLGRSERLFILFVTAIILLPLLGLIISAIFSNLTSIFRVLIYSKRFIREKKSMVKVD